MVARIEQDELNKIWQKWLVDNKIGKINGRFLNHRYNMVGRRNRVSGLFEDWIWSEGGTIIQQDRKLCIEFAFEEQATWFLIRHG